MTPTVHIKTKKKTKTTINTDCLIDPTAGIFFLSRILNSDQSIGHFLLVNQTTPDQKFNLADTTLELALL